MISAISRFRVQNGMEKVVERAFLDRPHLVDNKPGFLGMETFTDAEDAAVFYLVTRWTDAESYRAWHSSPAHHESHAGIPKGLKLDAEFTEVTVLNRITDPLAPLNWDDVTADAAPFLAQHLTAGTLATHCIVVDRFGRIRGCNAAATASFGVVGGLVGESLWDRVVGADAERLRVRVHAAEVTPDTSFLLNFLNALGEPFTLECHVAVQPTGFLLIGEPPQKDVRALQVQLQLLNNELAVSLRENERKSRAIAASSAQLQHTLEELQSSHWHLKKIQEVLPLCMSCGKVRSGADGWGEVVDYLKANALFLSHTYCPDCAADFLAASELDLATEK